MTAEKSYIVSLGGESRTVPFSLAMTTADEMHQRYGGIPDIREASEASARPTVIPSPVVVAAPSDAIDASAKARIDAQQAALRAAGVTGLGFRGEGGTGDQFYANGTRMMVSGYETHARRKAQHDAARPIEAVASELAEAVRAERRDDVKVTAREVGAALQVNGRISVFGKTLTEQAIRGLLARCESPALSYVLGVRDRMSQCDDDEINHADRAKLAEVLAHECKRAGDTVLQLRTRDNPGDVFAVVSPGYTPADAPEVVRQILRDLPRDAKGTWSYDADSTSWELRADVWTPTPVSEQAVGEPFAGYVSFQSRDNGTGKFRGGGGIEVLRCLNASVYVASGASVERVHRGRVLYNVGAMLRKATGAIDTLCALWGKNRDAIVAMPSDDMGPVPLSVALPGFWRFLLADRRSELAGVLPGRTKTHVEGLTRVFGSERRDADRLVRADFGHAFTRYIQGQADPVRRDAEMAVSQWLSSGAPIGCDLQSARGAS